MKDRGRSLKVISEQPASGRTSSVRIAWLLAWSLWVFSVVLVTLSGLLLVPNLSTGLSDPYWLNIVVAALAFSTVGALIASRRWENPIGWLFCVSGLLYGATVFASEYGAYALVVAHGSWPGGVSAAWLATWLYIPSGLLALFSLLLFPDGRPPSPRWRVVVWLAALGLCLAVVPYALMPGPLEGFPEGFPPIDNPFGIQGAEGFLRLTDTISISLQGATVLAPVAALFLRFRHARGEERQQIKWVAYAATILASAITFVSIWPSLDRSIVGEMLFLIGFLAIPLAIAIAILKYRLYDIDLIINRTLVYGALTICIVGIYVLVVGYLGALLKTEGDPLISLAATGVVAVVFQPLRNYLQRSVNRLIYGERDEPYTVISRLGERLEGTLAPEAVLPTIVQTVREALKLPYAAITLEEGEKSAIAAESGASVDDLLRLPLIYQGETIGELLLAPRSPGEEFAPADRRLLDGLTRQAGIAAHAVRLTADLQRSRERLVTAREEERRRLRRDLHDGLGPSLGSLPLKLDVAGDLLESDPAAARALLRGLKEQAQGSVTDIRRLVYELRPPALDDLGLVGAVREISAQYGTDSLRIAIETPGTMPPLPAAVEVAAYRITQEATTNVVRHAGASECVIRLALDGDGALHLEVEDDGRGISTTRARGVGIASMRERAEELGGSCVVVPLPAGGTRVRASLPCAVARPEREE